MYKQENNKIEFSYPIDNIFESAARVSAYNSRNIKDKDGKSLLMEYAISEDDKDVFLQGLASVLPEICEKIVKVTDSASDEKMVEIGTTDVKFIIRDNEAYNKNILSLVYSTFNECLVEGALRAWYKNCAQGDLLTLYSKTFADNLDKLFNRMFQLKIKKTTSTLGYTL